ncbi:hypothetical protein [Sphingomonas sp.]|uniref:hypothetical protein n=1 Tax=Sphingomonas sp. TaxID=28214 RepID=UPI0031E27D9B
MDTSRPPEFTRDRLPRPSLRPDRIGYSRIDLVEVQIAEGRPCLFVPIDRIGRSES